MKSWHMLVCAGLVVAGAVLVAAGVGAAGVAAAAACAVMMGVMVWMMFRGSGGG